MTAHSAVVETAIGPLTLTEADGALTGVFYAGHWHPPAESLLGERTTADAVPVLAEAERQIGEYLTGDRTTFDLPTSAAGDAFHTRIWGLLAGIPYGSTTSYGALAAVLGDPNGARRVGQAVGRNPLSIVVPCHRVIGKDGALTGYAGGVDVKRRLLELEHPDDALF